MSRKIWPMLALLCLTTAGGRAWCQQGAPTGPTSLPAYSPAPYVLPPVNQTPQVEPIAAPFVDEGPYGCPGWIASVELFLIRPHINTHFAGSPNPTDVVNLTTDGAFGTTVSPEFAIGYRLPEHLGDFSVKYRFEDADRSIVPSDAIGGTSEQDRFGMHIWDIDWSKHNPFSLGPGWDLRFNVGVQIETIFFETRRDFAPPGNPAGQLNERVTSNYVGVGPEAGIALTRDLPVPGLAVFGSASGSFMFGNIHQDFAETTAGVGGPGFVDSALSNQVWVPQLTLRIGLSYCPPEWNHCHLQLGYVWEEFWHITRSDFPGVHGGDIINRGLFFRAEFDF